MGTILKFAAFMAFLALAFYAGYELGNHHWDGMGQRLETIERALDQKMGSIDREMRSIKERETLGYARDAVERAREAVADKRFGDAERELSRASEYLHGVGAAASEKTKAVLASLRATVAELKGKLRTLGSRSQEGLRKIERGIDDVAKQWDNEE